MGLRGPVRDPNSRRGRQAARKAQRKAENEALLAQKQAQPKVVQLPSPADAPVCPEWLTDAAKVVWKDLLDRLLAAEVPVKGVDGYALAMAADALSSAAEWTQLKNSPEMTIETRLGISKLVQQYQSAARSWFDRIGATPTSRARMGVKVSKPKGGKLAELLAARAARKA
jgi:phage terminase small subunit